MHHVWLAVGATTSLLAAGCADLKHSQINTSRHAATGIIQGERIVVLLSQYSRDGLQVADVRSKEEAMQQCIGAHMQAASENLALLPAAEFRRLVSPHRVTADASKSATSLLRALEEPVTARRLEEMKVRYLLLLEVSYAVGELKASGLGAAREQFSTLHATVLDLRHRRIAGSIRSSFTGSEGGGFAVLPSGPIFAVVPVYFTSMTESRACERLSNALARLILVSPPGFDGRWKAEMSCQRLEASKQMAPNMRMDFGSRPAFSVEVEFVVVSPSEEAFSLQHGDPGTPGSFQLSGRVGPDGRLRVVGDGITADPARRQPFRAAFEGNLVEGRYQGSGYLGAQDCTLSMARR